MKYTREEALLVVKTSRQIPPDIDDIYLDDEEIIKVVVTNCGAKIQCASNRLRDNEEIVKIAISKHGYCLQYASDRLRDDEEIVKMAIAVDGYNLQYASDRLRNNEEIVKIVISKCGWYIEYASDRIKNNEEMVRMAFMTDSIAIHHVNPRFSNNLDVLMEASNYGPLELGEICDNEILSNRNFILKLLSGSYAQKYTTEVLLYIDNKLLQDYEVLYYISLLRTVSFCNIDCGDCDACDDAESLSLKHHVPENLFKLTNLTVWLKSQLDIKKGNGLQLYLNDYDISISFNM